MQRLMWGGPEPAALKVLTYAERKIIQRARIYICVKRVIITGSRPARAPEVPRYHERNVVAYPQNADAVRTIVGLLPEQLAETLVIQFVGGDRAQLRMEPSLSVSVVRLRHAFHWLLHNCWPWMLATKNEVVVNSANLGEQLENLLSAYAKSTGTDEGAMPAELLQGATEIPTTQAPLQQAGPADAVGTNSSEVSTTTVPPDDAAALLQGGLDDIEPLRVWEALMHKYGIHVQVQESLETAKARKDVDETARLELEGLKAVAAAVKALVRLNHADIKRQLIEFHRSLSKPVPQVAVEYSSTILSNFDTDFWSSCFVDLFYRGDCQERVPGNRRAWLVDFKWAKCLLTRADFAGWRTNLEFVASLYNVLLRRAQMRAVHLVVVKQPVLSNAEQQVLSNVSAKDFVAEALRSGECESLRKLLRRQGLDGKLQNVVRSMEVAFRHVRGSEAEKLTMRKRFTAMRIWNGFSALFFTLNPHDIRSPVTLALVNEAHSHIEPFSLDFDDEATEAYLERLLGENPRILHEMVVCV